MPVVLVKPLIVFVLGALGWAYVTRPMGDEEPETVTERITTNLGSAVVAGASAAAIAWIWRQAK